MKFLTRLEMEKFLQLNGLPFSSDDLKQHLLYNDDYCSKFKLPEAYGKILSGFRFLFGSIEKFPWLLITIEGTGVWPSSEDINLYHLLRIANGETRNWSLGEALFFEPADLSDLITFVTVFSNFRWDYRVLGPNQDFHLTVSHDDVGKLFYKGMTPEISDSLSKYF